MQLPVTTGKVIRYHAHLLPSLMQVIIGNHSASRVGYYPVVLVRVVQ